MDLLLVELPQAKINLRPLTFTRHLADLRLGSVTLAAKWQYYWPQAHVHRLPTADDITPTLHTWCINAALLPSPMLLHAIQALDPGEKLMHGDLPLAGRLQPSSHLASENPFLACPTPKDFAGAVHYLEHPWDLLRYQSQELWHDFAYESAHQPTEPITDPHTIVYNPAQVHVSPQVNLRGVVLDATDGPIYIGPNATLHARAIVRGPAAIGQGAILQPGAIVGPNASIGPYCKVGGEIQHSVMLAYSNKSHSGFVGHSYIGAWCNLGAGTQTANLRSNYGKIKAWSYAEEQRIDTEQQFLGLIMGDCSRSATGTCFAPGSVVGVSSNVLAARPPAFVPSFMWGEQQTYAFEAAICAAERCMERRAQVLEEDTRGLLKQVFELTASQRQARIELR